MLVGVAGPPLAGKTTVVELLVRDHGFQSVDSPRAFFDARASERDKDDAQLACAGHSVSECWRREVNIVIDNVSAYDSQCNALFKRPYFLLVYVSASLQSRYRRALEIGRVTTCEEFLELEDSARESSSEPPNTELTNSESKQACLPQRSPWSASALDRASRLRIWNDFAGIEQLQQCLRETDILNPQRLRPHWDAYFMGLANLASERTNCMKRGVGCVIVRDRRLVATGYNGTPSQVRNCFDGGCPRCNERASAQGSSLDLCLCLHAEENAIIEAGRDRCSGATLYSTLFPCLLCSKVSFSSN